MQDSSSGVLIAFALADHPAAVDRLAAGEQQRSLPAHRVGPLVDRRSTAPSGTRPASCDANAATPSSKSRYTGPWRWSAGSSTRQPSSLAHRGEQVRPLVVGQHDGDRLLEVGPARVGQRPDRAGGVDDVGVAEEHEGVDALVAHRRRGPVRVRSRCIRPRSGVGGDAARRRRRHQPGRHQPSSPRKRVMLPPTIGHGRARRRPRRRPSASDSLLYP